MDYLYIINPETFSGTVLNTMPIAPPKMIPHTYVHDTDLTFQQYKDQHGGKLIALDWDTFYAEYYAPHLKGLCKPFSETTEEQYWDGLECLPPKRWTKFDGGEFFFVGECYTASLYTCYVRKGDKYYTALRDIYTDTNDLINLKD
jgi:hypothetical protein